MRRVFGSILVVCLIVILSAVTIAADVYQLDAIKIIGNKKVKDQTILNLLPFNVGEEYSKDKWNQLVELGLGKLKDEQLFYNVNIFPFFSEEQKLVKILVEIDGEWTYQFGFGVFPLYLKVEERAFLGNTDTLGIELSTLKQNVYYEKRNLCELPLDLGIELFNQNKIVSRIYGVSDSLEEGYYARVGFGGSLYTKYQLTKEQDLTMGLSLIQDRFGTDLEDPILEREMGFFNQNQVMLNAGYTYSKKINDTELIFRFTGDGTKVLAEDLLYGRGSVDLRCYSPIYKKLSGALKIEYGLATGNTPYYRLFNLNNLKGVRGKQYIHPGVQKVLLKGELTYPLIYGIQIKAFVDVGNTWGGERTFSMDDFGIGYGFGLGYRAGMPINTTFRVETVFSENGYKTYFVAGESF